MTLELVRVIEDISDQLVAIDSVAVIGYEHSPPKISLEPLFHSFELLAKEIARVSLSQRVEVTKVDLAHPVHQQLTVYAWEVL